MPRPSQLSVESLERRDQPALFGAPWPNAQSLTMSFAPDGTAVAGYSQDLVSQSQASALFSEMGSAGATAAWQTEILRAFQTWAAQTNINIGLIPDAGSPFGPKSSAPGNTPGGDIRVGAYSTTPDVIAINQPYSLIGGGWNGTLLYNTAMKYTIGAQAGKYDIATVTLDEAGNILGLADGNDPTSALYGHYIGVKTGLTASDVTAVQSLYGGARTPDAFEGNETLAAAKRITPYTSPTDPTKSMVSAAGDLTTMTDVDHYVFRTSANTTSLTVRVNTVGLSLLTAKVTVYDSNNSVVATATSAGPLAGQDLVLAVPNALPGKDYKVRVERATSDVFGIGGYDLKVGYNFDPGAYVKPTLVIEADNQEVGKNETISNASTLKAVGGSANTQYVLDANISSATDVDWYKLNSPSSTPNPLTVTLTPDQPFTLYVRATLYDSNRVAVASRVLANGQDGRYIVQVPNPTKSSTYYLKVEPVGRNGSGLVGDYRLTADFTQPAVDLSTVAADTLTSAKSSSYSTLSVPEAKMFYFTLAATSTDTAVVSGVRMIVYDPRGLIVATLTADAGSTTSGAVFLSSGTYTVKFEGATKTGAPLTNLSYTLRTVTLSDPIDPFAPPPVVPTSPPPPPPPTYTTGTYTGPPLIDPWLNPWGV